MTSPQTPAPTMCPLAGKKILITRPHDHVSRLATLLRAYGAEPIEMPTIRIDLRIDQHAIAVVTFTSSSTVSNFAILVGDTPFARFLKGVVAACIGPLTAATVQSYGLQPAIVAHEYTIPALARAIAGYFACQTV